MPPTPMSIIKKDVALLAEFRQNGEDNKVKASEAECNIWNFAYGNNNQDKLRYALQQLTDFDNGKVFVGILEKYNLEGYIFKESKAETIVLFDSKKITQPVCKILDISGNDEKE